jgi:hypothetical protein
MRFLFAPLVALAVSLSACAHGKIAKTDIEDTPDNRAILDVMKSYQRAFEGRDADAVLALVSTRYFEDNGNTDRNDDYDYNGLKTALSKEFEKTKAARLEVRVDEIVVKEDKAYATIYYQYRAQSEFPVGTKWKSSSDYARVRFERENGKWMIIAGI